MTDKRWLCTGCLKSYNRRPEAIRCVKGHNDLIATETLKAGFKATYMYEGLMK